MTMLREIRTNPAIVFGETLLRGAGNCIFQNNPITGIIFIIGIAISSYVSAINFLIGSGIATLIAIWFKADKNSINNGLFSFAGGYVGLLIGIFAHLNGAYTPELITLLILGGFLAVPMTAALSKLLGKFELVAGPFPVLILLYALLAGILYTDLPQNSVAPQVFPPLPGAEQWSLDTFIIGLGNSFGQVFAQINPLSGFIFILGIAINSRISAMMGVMGALVGLFAGFLLGYDASAMASGALTFNSMLTGMALGGFFLAITKKGILYTILGSLLSMWLFFALSAILNPIGLPALSLPFLLVYWLMVYGAQSYNFVKIVPLENLSKPEDHLKSFSNRNKH